MTNEDAVERLLTHFEKSPTWKFHGLMRACALTDQQHIIPLFGLDPDIYLPPSDGAGPSGREPLQAAAGSRFILPGRLKKGILVSVYFTYWSN